jgi:hypothetical protein
MCERRGLNFQRGVGDVQVVFSVALHGFDREAIAGARLLPV